MDTLEQTGQDLERLEGQLHALLEQIRRLKEENHSLQARQDSLVACLLYTSPSPRDS